jgi:hypothetical protein
MRGDRGVQLPLRLPYRVAAHTKAHANAKGGGGMGGRAAAVLVPVLLFPWRPVCCCANPC